MPKTKCCAKNSPAEIKNLAEFLKIISEENRLKIICMLKGGEKCVCDIWQCLDLPQNLTSHHLKILKEFDLVSSRQKGLNVYYELNLKTIKKYLTALNDTVPSS